MKKKARKNTRKDTKKDTNRKLIQPVNNAVKNKIKASLTVEASLVLPLFLFFIMAFLYFVQIIILQESLQEAITETGFNIARASYIYTDFHDVHEAEDFDSSLLDEGIRVAFNDIYHAASGNGLIKYAVKDKLNLDKFNKSCIVGGFDGIDFGDSKILQDNDDIDIVARYRIKIPIHIFDLFDMDMVQRVKLRGWNGYNIDPLYTIGEDDGDGNERMVYITETGTVYHFDRNCSHLSLSVSAINTIPTYHRNKNGGKYYPCEYCIKGEHSESGTYYITSYGDRYHINKDCPKIKRTIRQIPISQVGERTPCKRCGGG